MSKSIVANRIYLRPTPGSTESEGHIAEEDFQEIAPDLVLLRGMKPSTTATSAGGVHLARTMADIKDDAGAVERHAHPVRACAIFEIVRMPSSMSKGNPLELQVGDFVHCRNSVVDPLLGNELATTDLYLGVIGIAERAPRRET